MGINVTPSAVWMGCPTIVLVSAISRTFSMVERSRSFRGLFFSFSIMPFPFFPVSRRRQTQGRRGVLSLEYAVYAAA